MKWSSSVSVEKTFSEDFIFDIQRAVMVSCKEWGFVTWGVVWSWWNGHYFSTFLIKTLASHKETSAACYKMQQGRSGHS
jgi:hypothetical protein